MLEKTKERGTRAQNFFFFRGKREHSARGSLESSLVFQSATLELPRALSRFVFARTREADQKKSAQKIQKRRVFEENWGEKTKPIYTHGTYIYTTREPTGRERKHKTKPLLLLLLRERDLFVKVARAMEVRRPELFSLRGLRFFFALSPSKNPLSQKSVGSSFGKKCRALRAIYDAHRFVDAEKNETNETNARCVSV